MTDEEIFGTMDLLREHAKLRRQESLTSADVGGLGIGIGSSATWTVCYRAEPWIRI